MKKRKALLFGATLTVLIVSSTIFITGTKEIDYSKITVATSDANFPQFHTVDELEMAANMIVVASFKGDRDKFEIKPPNQSTITLSKTNVQVEKVYKGSAVVGKNLSVYEEGAIVNDAYVNTEGYKWMDQKGRYLLFLRKLANEDAYAIVGIYQGKFDLNNKSNKKTEQKQVALKAAMPDQEVEFLGGDFEHFSQLKNQALAKFN